MPIFYDTLLRRVLVHALLGLDGKEGAFDDHSLPFRTALDDHPFLVGQTQLPPMRLMPDSIFGFFERNRCGLQVLDLNLKPELM